VAGRPDASRFEQVVNEFLTRVTVLPWDSAAAREYGKLRTALEPHGRPMGNLDLMIGAHATALSAVLVTQDQAFRRIRKLKVEDWTRL
jgi:tRNA(fMet)-specific endonuclease VapC